jgi:ribosomal subunit interface protein
MNLTIKGKQLDIGDALRSHITAQLNAVAEKYFTNPIEATVVVALNARLFSVDISIHVGRNIWLQSSAEGTDAYAALDAAAERLAKRLRRYKRRLRDHNQRVANVAEAEMTARQYILEGDSGELTDGSDEEGPEPVIVAEMKTSIETMTVGEAVMRLDLAEMSALMFRSSAHGGLNMVYRRPDGHIGWVDPQGNKGSDA